MMKIKAFDPKGILLAEKVGIKEIKAAFPNHWYGFSNLVIQRRSRGRELREIDVVVVTEDRIIIADLKHWYGKVDNRDNQWFQGDVCKGRSAVLTIEENAKEMKNRLENDLASRLPAIPWVDGFVVFTNPAVELSGLSEMDRARVMTLRDFLKLANPQDYIRVFGHPRGYYNKAHPLCGTDSKVKNALMSFFQPGKVFSAAEVKFGTAGYRPEPDACFVPPSRLYAEYMAELETDQNHTALLRLWDFNELNDLALSVETRRPLADREHSVLGYINQRASELYDTGIIHLKDRDPDCGLRYWELFEIRRSTRRLVDFVMSRAESLKGQERMEMAVLLLSRVADLHRIGVAHRDLAGHSVWVERPSRVFLSSFVAAHFPETETIGAKRIRLLASDVRLPEDAEEASSSPFTKDVFLLGSLSWTVLTGRRLQELDHVPMWLDDEFTEDLGLPGALRGWFAKALDMTPECRFANAVEMLDAFLAARKAPGVKQDLSAELARYRSETDPYFDYPVTQRLKKGRANVWVSGTGDAAHVIKVWGGVKDTDAVQLITFFRKAEALKARPIDGVQSVVEFGLCEQGPFLVVRFELGEALSAEVVQSWDRDTMARFLSSLAATVEALHERDVGHGDLKPDNVKVQQRGDAISLPVLLDIPDLALASDGELMNMAYQPTSGPSDPFTRDRFAVCKMAKDILGWLPVGAIDEGEAEAIRNALSKCEREEVPLESAHEEVPYLTLRPLREALDRMLHPEVRQERERIHDIVVPSLSQPEDLMPDNGEFYVIAEAKGKSAEIRLIGVDQELSFAVDRKTLKVREPHIREVPTRTVSWAASQGGQRFNGIIRALPGPRPDLSSLEDLIRIACEDLHQKADARADKAADDDLTPPEVDGEEEVVVEATGDEAPSFPVAELWRTIIEVERSMRPEVTVAGKIVEDRGGTLHLVPYEAGAREFEFSPGEYIHVLRNDRRIGILDLKSTTAQSLAIRDMKRGHNLQDGQKLQLESNDDYASFTRRSKAVMGILDNNAEIDRLVDYFDPRRKVEPVVYCDAPPEASIAGYKLNEAQTTAFIKLWTTGPVGLLQGPPGTGKTKFIASFVHFALTKGGMRNILVLSQSHEATNNAAEKIMELAASDQFPIEMVRIGRESKISERLLPHHSDAIQDRYRELFQAEMKERVSLAARRLGLPREYAEEVFELEATLGDVVERLLRLSSDTSDGDEDREFVLRRYATLLHAYDGLVKQWFGNDRHVEPEVAMRAAHHDLEERHRIRNPDAARRLMGILKLARDWVNVLSSKHRTLEDFLVRSRSLVCGTCVGIGRPGLKLDNVMFDLVVIDEAARCDPGELAVGMLAGKRVLLVGDHKQLPPLYTKELADEVAKRMRVPVSSEVTKSDFERIFRSDYGRAVGNTLNVQYRMAPAIGDLVSEEFYRDEKLINGRGDPPEWYASLPEPLDRQIAWVDTVGLGAGARDHAVGTSFDNRGEADTIIALLKLIAADSGFVSVLRGSLEEGEKGIGVICMYGAQKRMVQDRITATPWPEGFEDLIKVNTVDGYQGKENPIIIVSLTRNNPKGRIGHVESLKRMNVALSRAMDRLVLVGSSSMFEREWSGNPLKGTLARIRGGAGGNAHVYPAERLLEA